MDREPTDQAATPHWAEALVRVLDDGLAIPGTRFRFGLDGIIGLLVPGAGDALTGAGALSLFWLALQRQVPKVVLARMLLNIGIDALVGAIPILGDAFDFAWKANRKNLQLVQAYTGPERPRRARVRDYLVLGAAALIVAVGIALPFVLAGALLGSLWTHGARPQTSP